MKLMGKCCSYHSGSTTMIKYVVKMLMGVVFCYMMYDIVFGNYVEDLKPGKEENVETTGIETFAIIKSIYGGNDIVHEKHEDEHIMDEGNIGLDKTNTDHYRDKERNIQRKTYTEQYVMDDIVVNKKPDKETFADVYNILPQKTNDELFVDEDIVEQEKTKADQKYANETDDYEKSESYRILEEFKKYEELLKADNFDLEGDFELKNNKNTNLVINTYMRSGSSFLGKIFSMRPDTFYVYEPLWHVQKYAYYNGLHELCEYTRHKCVKAGRDAERFGIGSSVKVHDALGFLDALLHCNFKQNSNFLPDVQRFKTEFPSQKKTWNFAQGSGWDVYKSCSRRHGETYESCLKELQPVCKTKKHKVLKVLRTTLDNLEFLIKSSPNLKVIHLFRDPRGIINSHIHTPFIHRRVSTAEDIERDIETMCDRMRIDVQIALHLRRVYKEQFKIVQYEDFGNVLYNAKALYKFMNMDISDDLNARLQKLQYVGKDAKHAFHPYSYTKSLPWSVERIVNKYCHQIFVALGYPLFQNNDQFRKFKPSPGMKLPYSLSNT